MKKYDVFISYRRSGGEYTAKIIKDRLEDLGYRVFFDVESLRSGNFNTKLYSVIEECTDFLLILSPDSMERTANEDDWLRLEIRHALECNVNIVPVMLRGFEFPSQLPMDIDPIRFKNGLEANSEFFDAFIQKLSKSFLKSKPRVHNRITQNVLFRRTWPVLLSLVLIAGLVAGGLAVFNGGSGQYPVSREQKNLTDEVLVYMQNNLLAANTMVGEMNDAYAASSNYLSLGDAISYHEALSTISVAYSNIENLSVDEIAMDAGLAERLNDSEFVKVDLQALNTQIDIIRASCLDNLVGLQIRIDPDAGLDDATRKKWMDLEQQWVDLFAHEMVYATNMLLLPVSAAYISDFKQQLLPRLTKLPYSELTWQTNEEELNRLLESVYSQYDEILLELATIGGGESISVQSQEAELIEFAQSLGFSQSEAEGFVADILTHTDELTEAKRELTQLKLQLESELREASEKYAPLASDEPGIIWSKMLRFLKLSLYDDAIKCAQAYQQKVRDADSNADVYMPIVINFIQQIGNTGLDYGLVVLGFEPGKPDHALYKIGDIIVAMNGNPCRTVEEMESFMKETGNVVSILRPDEQGNMALGDYNMPTGQCRVLFYNLSEEES